MRILINALPVHPGMTGIGTFTLNLVRAVHLTITRHEYIVLHHPAVDIFSRVRNVAEHHTRFVPVEVRGEQWEEMELPRLASDLEADLYVCPLPSLPSTLPCASICTVHDLLPITMPDLGDSKIGEWFRRTIEEDVPRADRVMVVSEATRQDLLAHLGDRVDGNRVVVTHEGIEPEFRATEPAERERIRRGYDLPDTYFLYVSTIEPRKGIDEALEGFARYVATARDSSAQLILAGREDAMPYALAERVAGLGLSGRVRRLGYVPREDLPGLYSSASCLLFLSKAEGFGLPGVEAMACGTPVIASNAPALREVLGEAAILVESGDPARVAEEMARVSQDASLVNRLRSAGPTRAAQFSLGRWAGKLSSIVSALSLERFRAIE